MEKVAPVGQAGGRVSQGVAIRIGGGEIDLEGGTDGRILAADRCQYRRLVGLTDSNGHGFRIGKAAVAHGEGDIKGTRLRRGPGEAGIGEGGAGREAGG